MYKATKLNESQVSELHTIIETVKNHEDRTVALLGEALPLALNHVWGNENVTIVNKLVKALSPTNRKAAVVFFKVFQPHAYGAAKSDKRSKVFGKRVNKAHTLETKRAMQDFFSLGEDGQPDPSKGLFGGDYWLWESSTITVENKEIDFLGNIDKAVKSAKDDGDITFSEILRHTVEEEGLTIEDVLSILENTLVEAE